MKKNTYVKPAKHECQYDHKGIEDVQQIQKFLTIGVHTQHDLDDEDSQNNQSCDVHPLKFTCVDVFEYRSSRIRVRSSRSNWEKRTTIIVVMYLLISSDRVPVIMFERWVRYILDIQDYVHGKWKICNHEKKNN